MRASLLAVLLVATTAVGASADEGVGFHDPATGEWYLPGLEVFYYGNAGDSPMMGDWDCSGEATPGLHRTSDGFVYLRDTSTQGIADRLFYFGNPGDVPVAGDWNGDGCDTVSLWRPSDGNVYIINRLGSAAEGLGSAEYWYGDGSPGERPFAFDHDGDGTDSVAFHDPATGLIRVEGSSFYFGNGGDFAVAPGSSLVVFRPADRKLHSQDGTACRAGSRLWTPLPAPTRPSAGAVRVLIHPDERRALAPAVSLAIAWPGGSAVLTDCAPSTSIDISIGQPVGAAYLSPRGVAGDVEWTQVATGGDIVLRQPWRGGGSGVGSIVLAWQSTGDSARYLTELNNAPGLTVTSPIRWHLNGDGSVSGGPDAAFIASAHGRGLEVWPAIASLDAERIALAMEDPLGLAAQISAAAARAGADGVNIDLEGFYFEDADAVTAFAAELTDLVHDWGGVTSFDITPRTDTWDITSIEFDAKFWSQAPQRRPLADAVDYLILMAYDEHNRHRPAGPVASPHWVEDVTHYLLRYTDPHHLILGVPFYGRIWGPDIFDTPRARGIGSLTASEAGGVRSFDARFGLDRVDFPDGTFLWSETPAGLAHRVALKDELRLAGLAAWRLGFDSPSVWPVVAP